MPLVGCGKVDSGRDSVASYAIGSAELDIPKKYLLPGFPASMVPKGERMDAGEGVSLKIPIRDLGFDADDEKGLMRDVIVFLYDEPTYDKSKRITSDIDDAWSGKGLYREKLVEFDQVAGLYRFFPRAGYPKIWHYFSTDNTKSETLAEAADNWVASCKVSPLKEEADDLTNVSCKTKVTFGDIQIQISFSGGRIRYIDTIREQTYKMIRSWAN